MKNGKENLFRGLSIITLFFYLFQYIFEVTGIGYMQYPVAIDVAIFTFFSIWYILLYRRENLLCFEIVALPIAFLGLFFQDIIYPLIGDLRIHTVTDQYVRMKSADLQMIGYMSFFIGCSFANKLKRGFSISDKSRKYNYNAFLYVLIVLTILVVVYDYRTGVFHKWFFYSNMDVLDKTDKSEGVGLLTDLIIVMTLVDIIRLKEAGVQSFKSFLRKCNKISVFLWLLISGLLLVSGNRNEMLLVLLPYVVAYTICIKPIKSKYIVVALFAGVFLMVASGTTRHDGFGLSGGIYNLVTLTIDFCNLGYDCDYLVQHTDLYGTVHFFGLPSILLSGIPLFGHLITDFFSIQGAVASADLTTESANSISGLGTSLIGDLYYEAGVLWIIIYMFLFGYFMSRLYYSNKNISIYFLFIYSYMVANGVYYIRSSWSFPITRIEYVCIIILVGRLIFRRKNTILAQQ